SLAALGTNPPNGAIVYCYLKQKPEEEATLEVLDARDSVVRRFSSRPKEPGDSLKPDAGLNRFVWDLRYADAHRFKGLVFWAGNTRGPLAVPASYKVRVTVGLVGDPGLQRHNGPSGQGHAGRPAEAVRPARPDPCPRERSGRRRAADP